MVKTLAFSKVVKNPQDVAYALLTHDWVRFKNGEIASASSKTVEKAMQQPNAVIKIYAGKRISVQLSDNLWYEGTKD